ncbi:hypothetical protein SLEP1_g45558 [Rubroshorea leprosula]|uniref:Uncharacterized protein n=1 Tax=Rubroshorea leprosula TaxID=152421 RepID=A0AAV5LJE9_9ROSI|nr:hypothetical protein SLEP1_g45558 [Rubroshorea leprosula]
MHQKISAPPRLLSLAAGKSTCCIFRVPRSLVDINGKSYQPHIVSIGPYHHGEPQLKMIEEHKWRFLGSILNRIKVKGLTLEDLLKAVESREKEARECYSENLDMGTDEFVEMLVLDGCFIIELFRKVANLVPSDPDDPIFSMGWILPLFFRDFVRIENQIPYFVLEVLFDLSKMPGEESRPTLSQLALEFFNNMILRPDENIPKFSQLKGRHLLDLVRTSFIPSETEKPYKIKTPTHIIHCISKLRRADIKLKPVKAESFLEVKFQHGVIEMPTITVDDFMTSFLLNCVAYEYCHKSSSKPFTAYAALLDCLVNTYKDVEYLSDRNIIENFYGKEEEVARFINNMGKDISFDIDQCHLWKLFSDVHYYYRNDWRVQWAGFKYAYLHAALLILVLTFLQTFYTIYQNYHHD